MVSGAGASLDGGPLSLQAMAFDRIGACAAVLDGDGIIVATNGSWRLFADLNGGDAVTSGLGVNYLDVCDRAATAGIDGAAQTATGLRQILSGERERMDVEYPCSSPNEERWFLLQASAVSYADGEGVVLFHVDITTRKLQAERLAALAADDPLIGLPTRRAAVEHLGRQLTTTGTRAGSVWVHLIDVDHLRTVNEQHGHHVGDELLCRVARRAQHGLRGQGHLYRFGGDELVLISSGVDRVGAVSMAARLRALMDEPFQIEGIAVVGRVSVGLAGNEPGSTADSVLVAAGEDLDRAKRERADRRPGEQWGAHPATGRGEHAATDPVVDVADVLADLDSLIGAEAPGTLPGLTVVAEHLVVLERTAARYRTLVDHLPGTAVMVFDRDLCILVVAGPGTRLWRYAERGVAPGRYLRDILGPEELAVLEPFYRSALVAPGSLEYHSVTTGLDFHFAAVPVPNLDGEVDQLLVTVTDVTQAKADAEALREAERRYRTAFEEGPVGMAQTTLNGRFEGVNQALCDLTGYTADELGARTSMSITHDDDLEREDAARSSMIDGRSDVYRAEKRLLHADGEYIWVAVSIAVVRDGVRPLYFLHHFLDITDRKHIEAQLQHLADHDPLTGLANRRGFEAALGRHVSAVARYGYSGALLVLDLDHFKQINDTLGHRAGDELIVSLASVVRRRLRDTDIVGRLGGDEFAVLLPHVTQEQAEVVATSLLEAVRTEVTVLAGTHRRKVTTSIGIAAFDDPGLSGAELLVSADLAMYDAKEAGRDRYAVHEPSNTEPTTRARLAWVDRIIDALDHDRFTLFAQPIMHLATRRITRYELLLRMIDDDGEIISPATFLSVAEKFGLINRIDHWVVDHAITAMATHADLRPAFEVNLSAVSMGDADLLAFIERRLAESPDVHPSQLTFEVTETAAVANLAAARAFADRLTSLGCSFSLDDFGAGFGSFYYLKYLPFSDLKIDGDFIAQCLSNPTDRLVIDAVVTLAQGLGKHVIAEFVGDEATLQFLARRGVDYAQGFHVGRPVPLVEAMEQLASAPRVTPAA